PLITVGISGTDYVRGFKMTNCTLYGGTSSTFGAVGISFEGGAFECFLRNIAVWNFKTNLKFQAGSTNPCSLIFIDGFALQSNGTDTNARSIHVIMPATTDNRGFTTAIYFSNGHIVGPSTSGSYAAEIDGTSIGMSNVYFDVEAGKGILFTETNT